MKTIKDFDVKKFRNYIYRLGKESGIEREEDLEGILQAFLEEGKENGKTKVSCLTCGLQFPLSDLEHDCQEEDIWLYQYILSAKKSVPFHLISKIKMKYPLKAGNELVFRGLNFLTKESYERFMESLRDGVYVSDELSSWSLSYDYAKRFARCIQKGTRIDDAKRAVAYEKMFQDSAFMTGYKGVILMADISKKNVFCDISDTSIGDLDEKEVILFPGTYPAFIAHEIEYQPGVLTWTEAKMKEAKEGAGI
ncbi:hypothetical protein JMA_44360 (plasmid) [Jeotgalibacillus malaysiensis]|uniref:Uncharacterized protein n=1 Tax=Jeotgalibacillus malaysiensis TaxID=1508404 RepID=A0A0B5AZ38_9BACL|nr:hypothetical protein [Jeotgalibacillus malaysiensis]AJD93753.1 hypothetical protein JMA_44360 [Jeotgalibacillus malaysiensis]